MNINFIHDRQCIDEFINTFRDFSNQKDHRIKKLLESAAYNLLINDIGSNFNLTKSSQWVEIFEQAVEKNSEYEENDIFKKLVYSSVQSAVSNLEFLNDKTDELIQFIEKQSFITTACTYLPESKETVTVTIVYSVFMQNASVENNKLYLDVPFTYLLSEAQLNDFLAHEFHHYLKDSCGVHYSNYDTFPDLRSFLKLLESEGIANLCNFESLESIYQVLGINYGSSLSNRLKNIEQDFIHFFELLEIQLTEKDYIISFYDEFVSNFSYIPMSYFMARTILEQYGIIHLRSLVGEPILFLISFIKSRDVQIPDFYNKVLALQ